MNIKSAKGFIIAILLKFVLYYLDRK